LGYQSPTEHNHHAACDGDGGGGDDGECDGSSVFYGYGAPSVFYGGGGGDEFHHT
jgi:hypothetical protein